MTRTMHRLRFCLIGTAAAALALATTALGGSGVGDVFNLGDTNSVDATSTLSGASAGAQLKVTNANTSGYGLWASEAGAGTGLYGTTGTGIGVYGRHLGTTGTGPGVYGQSASSAGAGVLGYDSAGGPGLQAQVTSNSVPPLKVNSKAKVANLNADQLDGIDSTGFWKLGGNSLGSTGSLGTSTNQALELKVNGQRALRLEPNATSPNLVGGFSGNTVQAGAYGASVAGGGATGATNRVSDNFGTVGGGWDNQAGDGDSDPTSAVFATVGGGVDNTAKGAGSAVAGGSDNSASGGDSAVAGGNSNTATGSYDAVAGGVSNAAAGGYSAVAGGAYNSAIAAYSAIAGGLSNTANGPYSAVAGGDTNTASGYYSTVGGGTNNTAIGPSSAVAGGSYNTASGTLSFAAGNQAKATQNGSFVWGDSTDDVVTSPAANTFTVRASGGIWLGTNSSPSIPANHFLETSTGGYLSTGGAWTDASDRALKHDFRPLNKRSVLKRVAGMPIRSWSYKAERPSVRHIGPTAQDFHQAFGLGLDDKHIATLDESGVALAAIQGLYRQNLALKKRVGRLERELATRHSKGSSNRALAARMTRLERMVKAKHR